MARIYRHLFATVTSFDNLFRAARAAARGKRGQVEVAAFEVDLEWLGGQAVPIRS